MPHRRLQNPDRSLRHDDRGVTLVEYALALALALTVGTFALTQLGNAVTDQMSAAEAEMN